MCDIDITRVHDTCMICLEDCQTYINLKCYCKNICHEICFKEYIDNVNKNNKNITGVHDNEDNMNNKYKYMNNIIKCLICKSEENILSDTIDSSFLNSFLYSVVYIIQNFYFYLDNNYFPENLTFLRIMFALIFHFCLILVFLFPYLLTIFTIYINYSILSCKKTYKIGNL